MYDHIKMLTIHPLNLPRWNTGTDDEQHALSALLASKNYGYVWNSNEVYQYPYKNVSYNFTFTQSIIKQQAIDGQKTDNYELFDSSASPIGKGGYGIVYPIIGTISYKAGKPFLLPTEQRLVKIEEHEEKNRTANVYKEYLALLRADHVHVQYPLFFTDTNGKRSFLIMDYAKGVSLEKILHPEKRFKLNEPIPQLTVFKRLELTLALLKAIKTQVSDKNIVHRDLKPANIIVDLNQIPPKVTIIDYGFALIDGEQDYHRVGTNAYRAPESFRYKPYYTPKADVYSAGRILSYLWGDDFSNYYVSKLSDQTHVKRKSTNQSLFSLPEIALVLIEEDQNTLRNCIKMMMDESPDNRFSLDEAITQLSRINQEHYKQPLTGQKTFKFNVIHQISSIHKHLMLIRSQETDLRNRGFLQIADKMNKMANKITDLTHYFEHNADPSLLINYKKLCLKEIENIKPGLQNHRNARWLVAEIASAIALLGIGYAIALGINYYRTGRLGLFSQTKSDQLVDNVKQSIQRLSV